MFADIIFPKANEKDFLALAERLSIPALVFCYFYNPKNDCRASLEMIKKLRAKTKTQLYFGLVAKEADTMRARKLADIVLVKATAENRPLLEKKEADCIFELENGPKSDKMHYVNCGLNQVLCAVAAQSRMIVAFSFSMVLNSEPLRRATLLGRIRQNIRLCRKYKVQTILASFAREPFELRTSHDFINFGTALGMHPKDAQDSINNLFKRIEENRLTREGKYFGEGIEIVEDSSLK
jgi:RNase P/RNase MRP subunit p30